MIDLTKVRNFYIACGYTDLRLGIDGLAVATLAVPYNADACLRPEGYEHERTWRNLDAVRHQIVVCLIERDRHQHGHAAGARRGAVIQDFEQTIQRDVQRTRSFSRESSVLGLP